MDTIAQLRREFAVQGSTIAYDRAFADFKGACARGTRDNMKTAVERQVRVSHLP